MIEACIASVDGKQYIRRRNSGRIEDAEIIGRTLAREMIGAGGAAILQQAGRNLAQQSGS